MYGRDLSYFYCMLFIFRTEEEIIKGPLFLTEREKSRRKALRLPENGEIIEISNGINSHYRASLSQSSKIKITSTKAIRRRLEPYRVLCTAIPEIKRFQWLLEKSVELGVTHIQVVNWDRSVIRKFSLERANRIILQAAEQSQRYFLPKIYPPISWRNLDFFIQDFAPKNGIAKTIKKRVFVASLRSLEYFDDFCFKKERRDGFSIKNDLLILLVGPVGDFSQEEFTFFQKQNNLSNNLNYEYKELSLGKNILKVETAAITMLAKLF